MITELLWWLILAQMAMGAFDILWHHEFTERLAWRQSQKQELRLHGVRNFIYGIAFLVLGFMVPTGWLALVMIGLLIIEVIITLIDFVEEDRSRKLPETERITHTLLALNYGGILALLMPVLWKLGSESAGLAFTQYGIWSLLALLGSVGCVLFGIRDILAANRLDRLEIVAPDVLLDAPLKKRRILITGGTGFIGQRLIAALVAKGDDVTVLTRNAQKSAGQKVRTITSLAEINDDDVFDVVINLAGEPIVGGLWTGKQKRKIYRSRIRLTRQLVRLFARLQCPPEVFVSASAIGIYGTRVDQPVNEYTEIEDDGSFSHRLCAAWEREALAAKSMGIRTVLIRIGIVLDPDGGSLGQMLPAFEFGLGGPFGDGRHMMSWISRDDLVRLVGHCMANDNIRGPVNGVAPEPISNKVFAKTLGRALGRPAVMSLPEILIRKGLGKLGEEIFLANQNVLPTEALRQNFHFRDACLEDMLRRQTGAQTTKSKTTSEQGQLLLPAH